MERLKEEGRKKEGRVSQGGKDLGINCPEKYGARLRIIEGYAMKGR